MCTECEPGTYQELHVQVFKSISSFLKRAMSLILRKHSFPTSLLSFNFLNVFPLKKPFYSDFSKIHFKKSILIYMFLEIFLS